MRRVDASWSASERAGFIAAIASAGPTFQPGLLPRRPLDQTLATGVVSALNYTLVSRTQAGVRAVLRSVAPSHHSGPGAPGAPAELVAAAAGVGIGLVGWAVGSRPGAGRVLPTVARRLARSSLIAVVAAGADELADRLPPSGLNWLSPSARPAAALAGAALAARHIHRWRDSALAGHDVPAGRDEVIRSAILGAGLSVTLIGLTELERKLTQNLALLLATALPADRAGRTVAAAVANGAVLGGAAIIARAYLHRSALASQTESTRVELEYAKLPDHAAVSGGTASRVPFATLGTEGRRFVHRVTSTHDIAQVTGGSRAAPVRIYVGLQSAATPKERVEQAMSELEALGGWDRTTLCLAVPAGTGFVNPVAIRALEYLTGGDCATVALQYSLRRSYYSLNRVAVSAEQNRLFLAELAERLRARRPEARPRLLLYGESLGALAALRSLDGDGAAALDRAGVARALFVGTPSSAAWARRWRRRPDDIDPSGRIVEVASYAQWRRLPTERRDAVRVVLLSHHDDPVTIFDRGLLVRPAQARSLTAQAQWRPFTSYVLTAIDLKNAMNDDPARFASIGHDYRGDLARFVALAYGFDVDDDTMERIEVALRRPPVPDG